MASFAPIRGTKTQIENTPMVDGQFLIETSEGNQNKIYVDSYNNGDLQRTMAGGGGHKILPTIDSTETGYPPTEEKVVDTINTVGATATTDKIASLYGMNKWTNKKSIRRVMTGAQSGSKISATGIGTWFEGNVADIDPSTDEADWWYDAAFLLPSTYVQTTDTVIVAGKTYYTKDTSTTPPTYTPVSTPDVSQIANYYEADTDNIDIKISFDPIGTPVILRGYILDTDTGKICIGFANSIRTQTARIAVDITYTRNDIAQYSAS